MCALYSVTTVGVFMAIERQLFLYIKVSDVFHFMSVMEQSFYLWRFGVFFFADDCRLRSRTDVSRDENLSLVVIDLAIIKVLLETKMIVIIITILLELNSIRICTWTFKSSYNSVIEWCNSIMQPKLTCKTLEILNWCRKSHARSYFPQQLAV